MNEGLHANSESQILSSNPPTLVGWDGVRIADVDLQGVTTQPRRSLALGRPAECRFDAPAGQVRN
jgi:hypothetical protein